MQGHHPSSATSSPSFATTTSSDLSNLRRAKRRGNYNCGRCGLPKKGHSCHGGTSTTTSTNDSSSIIAQSSSLPTTPTPSRHPFSHLRRALSFDDNEVDVSPMSDDEDCSDGSPEMKLDSGDGRLPWSCMWEVLRRLPPASLLSAAKVCKGWRDCTRKLWRAAEELRLRVPAKAQVGLVGSVLQKCSGLVKLSLRMESDVNATMLACIAFSCPNLVSLEIRTSECATNRISGDELGRFVADKRCLSSLKMEGCSNLGGFSLCSSSLSTLWLSDLFSLSKMVFNCPNLKELSLDFSRQENDCTDLATMVDALGRTCPRLRNIHIASLRLSHAVVLALTAANLRNLCMLSLVLGSEITDASVAAIASSYDNLELLDLSGSSISDSGIGMICNVFPETLSRLLLALCPNISSSGIQFATAQLPLLELMDCGMTICDPNSQIQNSADESDCVNSDCEPNHLQKTPNSKLHHIYQKLIIKHGRLKKLSLWGCSGLDALYLNCHELNDLNLNSCSNLHPERLLLQCPSLQSIHALGCQEMLIEAIQSQAYRDSVNGEDHFPCKRLADGSKRVRVPNFLTPQPSNEKKVRRLLRPRCSVLLD
ncbi:F-box/LRR-repeat protein 17-like [Macadamia integrifolia]|uniref:F-box/LRR-repeat protein 17-like n=1 Tax=Macadamia integrifolia TaxID=60698 RepID=UPI001C4F1BD2|nr:F-box/LRR-repeat protein 17-like [Macadamia integrifolia]